MSEMGELDLVLIQQHLSSGRYHFTLVFLTVAGSEIGTAFRVARRVRTVMGFEPQKFFIGVIDFFSVLLPGAILTYLLMDDIGPRLMGSNSYAHMNGVEAWLAFAVSSYLAGHFIFLIGSFLLDEWVYDRLRQSSRSEQIKRLAEGNGLSLPLTRWLGGFLLKQRDRADITVRQAIRMKNRYLEPIGGSSSINAFQWSKARLMFEQPKALAEVQRFEADSKFFRSLVVVLGLLAGLMVVDMAGWPSPINSSWFLFLGTLVLLWFAFWRFVDQRLKSINQAYWYVITLEGSRGHLRRSMRASQLPEATHAGGVVYREDRGNVTYLLVHAGRDPREWVIPEGKIAPGEPMEETAVRKVWEEAGVWARVVATLDTIELWVDREPVKAGYYLMRFVSDEWTDDAGSRAGFRGRGHITKGLGRERVWLQYQAARLKATHDHTREALDRAHHERRRW